MSCMACSQVAVLQDSLCAACNSQWKFTQGEEEEKEEEGEQQRQQQQVRF